MSVDASSLIPVYNRLICKHFADKYMLVIYVLVIQRIMEWIGIFHQYQEVLPQWFCLHFQDA